MEPEMSDELEALIGAVSRFLDRDRELAAAKETATGSSYFLSPYYNDVREAGVDLERAINALIDRRIDERLGRR